MLHNIRLYSFQGLTDKDVMNKDTVYELLFLAHLYDSKRKAGEASVQKCNMVRVTDPKLFHLFIL